MLSRTSVCWGVSKLTILLRIFSSSDHLPILLPHRQLGDLVTKKERDRAAAAKASADFKMLFNTTVEDDEKALIKQVETLTRES